MDEPNHPAQRKYTKEQPRRWSARVDSADAFVFVMSEYDYGFSAPLKNAIDYLHHEWGYKPVGFVSYGGISGGTRAVQMIKQVVTTVRMMPLPEAYLFPLSASSWVRPVNFGPTRCWRRPPTPCSKSSGDGRRLCDRCEPSPPEPASAGRGQFR